MATYAFLIIHYIAVLFFKWEEILVLDIVDGILYPWTWKTKVSNHQVVGFLNSEYQEVTRIVWGELMSYHLEVMSRLNAT